MADKDNARLLALALQSMGQPTPQAANVLGGAPSGALADLAARLGIGVAGQNAGAMPLPNPQFTPNAPGAGMSPPQLMNPQFNPNAPGAMPQQLPNPRYGG